MERTRAQGREPGRKERNRGKYYYVADSNFSNGNEDVVLDTFAGVGTTCAVFRMTGGHYLGIDISREYCGKSEERLEKVPQG